jgi:hypothetical protein
MSAFVVNPVGAGFAPPREVVDPAGKPASTVNRAVCRARAASTRPRIVTSHRRRSLSMRSCRCDRREFLEGDAGDLEMHVDTWADATGAGVRSSCVSESRLR